MKTNARTCAVALAALTVTLTGCTAAPTPEPAAPEQPASPTSAAVGETLTGDGWEATINAAAFDSDDTIAQANEFNPAPGEGEQYTIVNLTLSRTVGTGTPLDVVVTVTVDGDRHIPAPAAAPEQLPTLTPVTSPAAATGNLAFLLPEAASSAQVNVAFTTGETYVIGIP